MNTLRIIDLDITEDLDRKAMSAVLGGTSKGYAPSCGYGGYGGYDKPSPGFSKSEFNFDARQSLDQCQNTEVNNGNNVAYACGINATVNPCQTGNNNISFGHPGKY